MYACVCPCKTTSEGGITANKNKKLFFKVLPSKQVKEAGLTNRDTDQCQI